MVVVELKLLYNIMKKNISDRLLIIDEKATTQKRYFRVSLLLHKLLSFDNHFNNW